MQKLSYNQVFGAVLRLRRKRLGLEQDQVARLVGLSQGGWSRVESGRNSLSPPQIARAARALGVTPGVLFASTERMRRKIEDTGRFEVLERSRPRDKKTAMELGMLAGGAAFLTGIAVAFMGESAGFEEDESG